MSPRSVTIMTDEQEPVSAQATAAPGGATGNAADRTFLLECRLDQLHSALQSARAEADVCRTRLAESAAREADQARRALALHEELASAREEIAALHRRLEHSEALRAESEGRLLESGARDEAAELSRLRRKVKTETQRADVNERTFSDLRARIEELTATRETLLTRVAEWQSLVRSGDPEAVDLSEFIAALRGDILDLEQKNVAAEKREAELREQLERAVAAAEAPPAPHVAPATRETTTETTEKPVAAAAPEPIEAAVIAADSTEEPTEGLAGELAAAGTSESRIELLLRLGRSGGSDKDEAFYAIRRWATATEPRVRAAAFEALGRLLEDDAKRLEPHLRWGLADADPRVRRRVVLAAATARGMDLKALLAPLEADPDPQVRRVTHEVLRRVSQTEPELASAGSLAAV
jgi:hypothetical protein